MQVLLPCEDLELRLEASNRQFFRVARQERLPREMELDLLNILIQELKVFKELDKITYDLEQRPDYSSLACFRAIDRANEGRLDLINIKKFFQLNSIFLTDREVLALIRRLDTTADQTVSHEELRDYIEQQVGFRSSQAMKSLAQGTPEARTEFHQDL